MSLVSEYCNQTGTLTRHVDANKWGDQSGVGTVNLTKIRYEAFEEKVFFGTAVGENLVLLKGIITVDLSEDPTLAVGVGDIIHVTGIDTTLIVWRVDPQYDIAGGLDHLEVKVT